MTVSTVVNHEQYDGNGTTTSFPYRFRVLKSEHMVVTVSDPEGRLSTLTLGMDYDLSGVGMVNGGNVILKSPLQDGWKISLDRDLPAVQETDLRNQGRFFAETHEDAFDYLTMLVQKSLSYFGLALRKPSGIADFYDAKNDRISNLADPVDEMDSVNNRTLKNYVDRAIAGVTGGFGWFIQAGAGAVYRTFQDKMRDTLSVKDFGAKGDGVSDDTVAFRRAIEHTSQNGKSCFVPDGIYLVDQIVILPHTRLYGNGRSSRIKRRTVNGLDLVVGLNSDSLWNSSNPDVTNFAFDVEIHSLFLDGGVDGALEPFSASKSGSAIAIWGHNLRIYNIDIINFAEHGIRTQCTDTNVDFATEWQESSFYSIRIRNVGAHGWMFFGPHDSKFVDVSIINASQRGDNLYDGLITGDQGTGDFSGIHISVSGNNTGNFESLRSRYSLNLNTPCRFSGGSSFEGSRIPTRIASSGSQFDSSCTYYAAWGIGNDCIAIKLEGICGLNQIRGKVNGSSQFRPGKNQFGIVFGATSSDSVSNNIIDMQIDGCNIPISFGASTTVADGDKGKNTIRIKSYYNGSQTPQGTYGVLNSSQGSTLEFDLDGTSTQTVRSFKQTKSQTIAAGQTYTWTFKYKFPSAPIMSLSIVGPSATPNGGVWVNGISGDSVSIVNGTGTQIILNATASTSVAV